MFDFLKECDDFCIYDRAVSCEKTVSDSCFIILVRVFFEAALKLIYSDEYNVPVEEAEYESFYHLLNNDSLIETISRKYKFNNIELLNRFARKKGNRAAHSAMPGKVDREEKILLLKNMYRLGKGIYEVRTKNVLGELDPACVQKLMSTGSDCAVVREIENRYSAEISRIREELRKAEEELQEKEARKNSEIEELRQTHDTMLGKLREKDERLKALNEELKTVRYENIPKEEYEEKCREIKKKDAAINSCLTDIEILKNRIFQAESSNNSAALEKYEAQNAVLKKRLEESTAACSALKEQLENRAKESCDKEAIEKLENGCRQLQESFDSLKSEYETVKTQLKEKENEEAAFTAFSELEQIEAEDLPVREQYEQYRAAAWDSKYRKDAILKQIRDLTPYECPYCGEKLSAGMQYGNWYCRHYREPGHEMCKNARRYFAPGEKEIAEQISELWNEYNQEKKDMETAKDNAISYRNEHTELLTAGRQPYCLPRETLNKLQKKTIEFCDYPASFVRNLPNAYLFESLSVPSSVFGRREELELKRYSRFRVSFGKDMAKTRKTPGSEERTLYTLILRLLNRGIVLRAGEKSGKLLESMFPSEGYCLVGNLFDYIRYSDPRMEYRSDSVKQLAKRYLPEVLGRSWASYAAENVCFDSLIPQDGGAGDSLEAPLLLFDKYGLCKPLAIEITDRTSPTEAETRRAELLRGSGYLVYNYTEYQIESGDPQIAEELSEYFSVPGYAQKTVEVSQKLLVAHKLQHQIAIAIAKALEQGFVSRHAKFALDLSSDLFSKEEQAFLLDAAVVEVDELLRHYSALYSPEFDFDLRCDPAAETVIHVGDGSADGSGILIRDCMLHMDYLCELEPFTGETGIREGFREEDLTWFLRYIFGHGEFREGQVEALRRLLTKKDSVVLLATGAGKSMIYQLASYLAPGMVIVISPLKSLILDQVQNLSMRHGINNVTGIASFGSSEDRRKTLSKMKHSATSLLYIAPERMQIPNFRKEIAEMLVNNRVFAIAVDEAHCVSEWGHDFRPAYLAIGRNTRRMFTKDGQIPAVIALTGTASKNVLKDIQRTLEINGEDAVIWPESFDRTELHFSVIRCKSEEKTSNLAYIVRNDLPDCFGESYEDFVQKKEGDTRSGIVFVPFTGGRNAQYSAQDVLNRLKEELSGMSVDRYYSKVPDGWENKTWEAKIALTAEQFRNNQINLLVATKAFGMGIDKNNIRYTIHDGIPQSLESFYQEAGRAGRDRNHSECFLLFSDDDTAENTRMLSPQMNLEDLRTAYHARTGETDDVKTQLYFHLTQYKGIESEKKTMGKVLNRVCLARAAGDEICEIACAAGEEDVNDPQAFSKEEIRDNGKAIAQAVIRLINLNLISDYEFDYQEQQFNLYLTKASFAQAKEAYLAHVESYDSADRETENEKVRWLKESTDSYEKLAGFLLDYTYGKIEIGRRNQLINMYTLAKEVAGLPEEKQDEEIRRQLNSYFSTPASSVDDPIAAILAAKTVQMPIAWNLFHLSKGRKRFTKEEQNRAADLAGRAIHELESSMGSRPDLIMVKDICQIVARRYSKEAIAADLVAIDRYSRERYFLAEDKISKTLGILYNLALCTSTKMFLMMLEQMAEYRQVSARKMLEEIMMNPCISEENRDYLVMLYCHEALKHLL